MKQSLKKQWQRPVMEVITLDELNKIVVSGACSTYKWQGCEVIRITRV